MLVPRLRVPIYSNIGECLKNWLDASYNDHESSSDHRRPTFTSFDCINELKELNQCRKSISDGITSSESYENARELIPVMQKYHAMLLEFENQGFPSENGSPQIRLEWEGAFSGEFSEDFLSGLSLERASILWNLAAVESYLASTQDWFASSKACMQASKHFQTSYSLLDHLQELLNGVWEQNCTDFQSNMVTFWKNVFQAQSQVVGYEMASFATRPRHLMLAKLAQGSVPLWNAAIDACTSLRIPQAERWKTYSQAWAAYMSCRAEWHESLNHREKNQIEHEIGRLKRSLSFGSLCYRLWKNGQADERLTHILPNYLRSLRERFAEYDGKVKIPNEIREIRGELLSKGVDPLIPAMIEPPATIFADAVKSGARKAVDKFNGEMYKFLDSMSKKVETTLNKTKEMLHSVNLPRALTIHSNGGPGDNGLSKLMSQVEIIQRRHNPDVLRKEFWELQVLAERANILFEKATKQLDEDVDMDALFRQQNPRFSGSVVREVQSSFRQILSKLMEALRKSRNGDDALRSRLEGMKNNSKINVLYSLKLHLDHRFANRPSNANGTDYDTSKLSRLLADLSDLFRDINTSLTILKEEVTNYDIEGKVGVVDPNTPSADREYEIIVKKAQKSFSGTVYEIQRGLDLQEGLLTKILEENDVFVASTKNSHHDDIPIPLIEAAMHYIDEIIQNLRDGKNLYQKVLSELEYLDQQVGEASVRLTIERCEYEEKNTNSAYRIRQEEEDARMAVSLAGGRNPIPHSEQSNPTSRNLDRGYPSSSNPSPSHQSHSYPTSHPGFVSVDHRNPHVRIDDEKVASLVAMDFDAEKVVAALIKHNNNVEQALNELLSGAAQQ